MQFLISSRLESSVLRASASCRRDSAGFDSNSLSAARSFIAAPVMFCTMESWSSVASRVRSLTFSSETLLKNLAAARSRPFLSDIFLRRMFHTMHGDGRLDLRHHGARRSAGKGGAKDRSQQQSHQWELYHKSTFQSSPSSHGFTLSS